MCYCFLSDVLSKLGNMLEKGHIKHICKFCSTEEEFEVTLWKGIFPYEYIPDPSRYDEPALPPIEAFYSSLSRKGIGQKEYKFAQKVFKVMMNVLPSPKLESVWKPP